MARGDMGNLMRHHSGQFSLILCRENQPAVHVKVAARKRKGGAAQAPAQERKADGAREEAKEERKPARAAKKPRSRKKAA